MKDVTKKVHKAMLDKRYEGQYAPLPVTQFTVDEILEVWYSVYGKDMAEPKFIEELRQRIA